MHGRILAPRPDEPHRGRPAPTEEPLNGEERIRRENEEEEGEEHTVALEDEVIEDEVIAEEVIDLTRDESPEVEIVHSTVVPSVGRSAKRPRINPAKALEALDKLAVAAARSSSRVPTQPQSPKGPKCGICLESMGGDTSRQMMAGNCGHVYCRDCLEHTVKTTKKCPTCRKGLQVRQLHPVFVQF